LFLFCEKIRTSVPEASLRTTLITGFPGEEEKDFIELLTFIEDIQFDHLGVFIYSDFEDLPSHRIANHVPERTAKERYHKLMSRQLEISLTKNKKLIGKKVDVLVENKIEEGVFMGRTRYQSPEVDGVTYIHAASLLPGAFVKMNITDVLEYDLIGDIV
jgi:ribosomal protein S12 methylthiotransferase